MAKKATHGGFRKGSGRDPIDPMEKKHTVSMQVPLKFIDDVSKVTPATMKVMFTTAVNRKRSKLVDDGTL